MRIFQSDWLWSAVAALLRTFTRDRRGSVSLYVATAIVPLVGIVGVSIDAARGYLVKSRLSSAVDAAALAGGRIYGSAFRDADIQKYFDTNFPPNYMNAVIDPLVIATNDASRTLVVSTQATIPTTFMRLLGFTTMSASAQAEATLESKSVEVSLVLDITGSMSGQRIIDLKSAANELVDIVVQDQQTPFYSKIAIIPYSNSVNVSSTYANLVRGTYTTSPSTCSYPAAPTCQRYRFPNYSPTNNTTLNTTFTISNCVTERTGPQAYTDAAPSVAFVGKHYPPAASAENGCPSATIMPLTSNRTTLHSRINGLSVTGSTAGHIGLAWGWYMISPNFGYLWPASQPAPYSDETVIKVVILMTDGDFNTVHYNGVIARNSTSGSGSNADHINHDSHNGNAYAQATQLCNAMKTAGVIVYTVGFAIASTPAAVSIMQTCATSPAHAYLPDNGTELKQAFRAIAMRVSVLRLSK
jgi:Flp pilus assembly protein TadG